MKPKSIMLIAGEPSGDLLGAELTPRLLEQLSDIEAAPSPDPQPLRASLTPRFFGAGGPRMAAAGTELAFDLTAHSVTGLSDVLKRLWTFRRLFLRLLRLAQEREPDAIICIDFSGFNRRFAHAVKQYVRGRRDWFHDWDPKIIQYVSPQVWASRASRVRGMESDYDLVLSILPFEKEWYASRAPSCSRGGAGESPVVLLLPGSRPGELSRHLPVMAGAVEVMRRSVPGLRVRIVLPDETSLSRAKASGLVQGIEMQVGGLAAALKQAIIAIASTGTVTLECALFGVPTVAIYKTSWLTYQIARRMVTVKYIAMPNLLANEMVLPELIQDAATPQAIGEAAMALLRDENRRREIKMRLKEITRSLGEPGATERAARAIVQLVERDDMAMRAPLAGAS